LEKKVEVNSTVHSILDAADKTARTATKPQGRKRGRKGDKISIAFKELPITPLGSVKFADSNKIPSEAVDFEDYCKAHGGISQKVMRQIKRHDSYSESGKAHVRKDRNTKRMMIWREHN